MRTIHAWDCTCGTRNAPAFVHCRHCDGTQSQGRPVAGDDPEQMPFMPAASPQLVAIPWGLIAFLGIPAVALAFLGFGPWESVLVVLAGLSLVSWPVLLIVFALLLLLRIARGVERMGR